MCWARVDKKKRGAKKDNAFYKKHGQEASKESAAFCVGLASVTVAAAAAEEGVGGGLARWLAPAGDMLEERIAMDGGDGRAVPEGVGELEPGSLSARKRKQRGRRDEADEFLGEDLNDEEPAAARSPSKMRSDCIAQDGRTAARTTARLPRSTRERGGQEEGSWSHEDEPGPETRRAKAQEEQRCRGRRTTT